MTLDVRPVCMFCQQRFSLRPGEPPSACESWRALDGAHAERRTATPEQHARLRLDHEPEPVFETSTLMDPDDEPIGTKWRQRKPPIPSPTPFDPDALRAGKPATGQSSLF